MEPPEVQKKCQITVCLTWIFCHLSVNTGLSVAIIKSVKVCVNVYTHHSTQAGRGWGLLTQSNPSYSESGTSYSVSHSYTESHRFTKRWWTHTFVPNKISLNYSKNSETYIVCLPQLSWKLCGRTGNDDGVLPVKRDAEFDCGSAGKLRRTQQCSITRFAVLWGLSVDSNKWNLFSLMWKLLQGNFCRAFLWNPAESLWTLQKFTLQCHHIYKRYIFIQRNWLIHDRSLIKK